MKSLFAIAAFVLAVSATVATAKPITVQIDGTCDTITLTKNKALVLYATTHIIGCTAKHAPSSNPIPGVGVVIKRNCCQTKRQIAVTDTQPDASGTPIAYMTVLAYPLVTGGEWIAYATADGQTVAQVGAGTYTVK